MPENQNIGSFTYTILGDDTPLKQLLRDYDANTKRLRVRLEVDQRDLVALQRPVTIPVRLDLREAQNQLSQLSSSLRPNVAAGGAMPWNPNNEVRVKNFVGSDIIGGVVAGSFMNASWKNIKDSVQFSSESHPNVTGGTWKNGKWTTQETPRNPEWDKGLFDAFRNLHEDDTGAKNPFGWFKVPPGGVHPFGGTTSVGGTYKINGKVYPNEQMPNVPGFGVGSNFAGFGAGTPEQEAVKEQMRRNYFRSPAQMRENSEQILNDWENVRFGDYRAERQAKSVGKRYRGQFKTTAEEFGNWVDDKGRQLAQRGSSLIDSAADAVHGMTKERALGDIGGLDPILKMFSPVISALASPAGLIAAAASIGAKTVINMTDAGNTYGMSLSHSIGMGKLGGNASAASLQYVNDMANAVPGMSFLNKFNPEYQKWAQVQAGAGALDESATALLASNRATMRQMPARRFLANLQPFEAQKAELQGSWDTLMEPEKAKRDKAKAETETLEQTLANRQAAYLAKHKARFASDPGYRKADYEENIKKDTSTQEERTALTKLRQDYNDLNNGIEKSAKQNAEKLELVAIEEKRHFTNVYRNADFEAKALEAQKTYDITRQEYDSRKIDRLKIAQNFLQRIAATGDTREKALLKGQMANEIDWSFRKPLEGSYETHTGYDWKGSMYSPTPDQFGNNGKSWMTNMMFDQTMKTGGKQAMDFINMLPGMSLSTDGLDENTKALITALADVTDAVKNTPRTGVYGN